MGSSKIRQEASEAPMYRQSLKSDTSLRRCISTVARNTIATPLVLSCLHALRLCFLLTLFVRPDRFYRLPDSLRTLPLSRYLAALVSTRLIMLTFLFRLRFSRSRCYARTSRIGVSSYSLYATHYRASGRVYSQLESCLGTFRDRKSTRLNSSHYSISY